MPIRGLEDDAPLLRYADTQLWGNPEENIQYQVKLVRVTGEFGCVSNFSYMNRWRVLPKPESMFHIFSVGGLEPGFWNFMGERERRNPLDRWINASRLCQLRGIQLDLYNAKGFQYSRSHAWIMNTYDGLTLIAFEKLNAYPIPLNMDMYFRCYSPTVSVTTGTDALEENGNPYIYETMFYENSTELATFIARYSELATRPGFTGIFHNGVYFAGPLSNISNLAVGDVVEIWHDPTVIRTEVYQYKNLKDFYSSLDEKRKVILHPPKRPGDFGLCYFDDNDYYLVGAQQKGLYFPRNSERAVRQLTHVDVSVADDLIQAASTYHASLEQLTNVNILVLVRGSDWQIQWPNEHQRIRYLYRMSDDSIMKAFTGARATVPEWTAAGLEQSVVMTMNRSQWKNLKREDALLSLGYNASTRVISEVLHRVTYNPGELGVAVPPSYQDLMTAWEYDENGLLLGYQNCQGLLNYSPADPNCAMVEFILGNYARNLDYVVTTSNVPISDVYGFRVYISPYSVALGELTGEMVDVTGDDSVYTIQGGTLIWNDLDTVNQRGVIFSERGTLAYTFTLDHIDHSLAFALTHIYEGGGLIFPFSFAETDVFINGHPLIDNVDWIYDGQYCYINNKEFLVEGEQTITVRAYGYRAENTRPNTDTELGFVDGGVIGRVNRYNLRADRVTRTVIGGSLYLSDEVPRAERSVPNDLWSVLNGRPYMVKHTYTPLVNVKPHDTYPYRERSRETDKRVSDYLTLYLPKPTTVAEEITWENGELGSPEGEGLPVVPNLLDRYRLYSPFMNVIVNGLINGLISLPTLTDGATVFSAQDIQEAVSPYLWWLKYDPINLNYDLRYFAVMPFANIGVLTMTSKELIFLNQVNNLYLKSVCAIEGHFEVNDNVR